MSNRLTFTKNLTKILATVLVSGFSVFFMTACESKEEKKISKELIQKIEAELHVNKVSQPFARKDYPNIYKLWGEDWMNNINTMLPLAGMKVTNQKECDKVRSLHLSASSIEGVKPILAVACDNNERFMVGLGDLITDKRILPLSALFDQTPLEVINHCFANIADEFSNPETMVNIDSETQFLETSSKNKLKLIIPFNVTTEFGNLAKHTISCDIDENFATEVDFIKSVYNTLS